MAENTETLTVDEMADTSFTSESDQPAGLYLYMPQGHALLRDGDRALVVMDLHGVVTIAGIEVTSPEDLRAFGEHLVMLAGRLEHRAAHPYHPGTPCHVGH